MTDNAATDNADRYNADRYNAYLSEVVNDTLSPYRRVLPPELADTMREFLEMVAETHPVGSVLFDRARPRKAPDKSGDQALTDVDAGRELPKKQSGGA